MDDARMPSDPEAIHAEMLRFLEEHPPPAADPAGAAPKPPARSHPQSQPSRPVLMLRRLRLEVALSRLEHFVRVYHRRGSLELLVIAGRGRNSPGGEPVLGPAVRAWCESRPDLVAKVSEAPPEAGGAGAMVVRLTRW
jgi:DNA-nicking Smr family endonuclease